MVSDPMIEPDPSRIRVCDVGGGFSVRRETTLWHPGTRRGRIRGAAARRRKFSLPGLKSRKIMLNKDLRSSDALSAGVEPLPQVDG
jgi:hypothetical protein